MKKLLLLLWIIPLLGFSQGGGKTIAFQKNTMVFNGQASSYYLNTSATGQTKTGTLDLTITNTGAGGDRGINLYASQTTNALTGTLAGIKSSARINVASASGTVRGLHAVAGNMDAGYALSTATGVYAEVTNKIPSGAVAWTNARGLEINMDLDQGTSGNANTITNAAMIYGVYNLPTVATYSTVTNGYGAFLRNEAVGGTGQMLDAGFYLDDLNHSGGIKGWDYGIDFSGIGANSGSFGTADFKFSNGALINNSTTSLLTITEATVSVDGILAATGNISGTTEITLDTDPTIVLSVTNCRNKVRFNNDADVIDYTLPGAAAGLVVMLYDIGGGVITVDTYDGTDTIYLNGTSVGAGDAIDSPGAVGDFICLMAIDDTRWVTIGRSGTWIDGGAD